MADRPPAASRVRFGTFEADLESGELRRHGTRLKLQDQPFQLLAMFLERPGEVVTREAVRERLWPADTFVDFDHSLNSAIKKLRQALGDSAENPRFVETLARRGYRFIAPVGPVAPASAGPVLDGVRDASIVDRAGAASYTARPPPSPRLAAADPGASPASLLLLIAIVWGTRRWVGVRPRRRRPAARQSTSRSCHSRSDGGGNGKVPRRGHRRRGDHAACERTNAERPPDRSGHPYKTGAPDPRRAGQELDAEHVCRGRFRNRMKPSASQSSSSDRRWRADLGP